MDKRPLTLEDFWQLKTVSDVQLSPDGRTVAYVVGWHDEKSNKQHSAIWLADTKSGATRLFTSGEAADSQPRWSRDGTRLAFVSTRHEDKPQIYLIDVAGGEPRRMTSAANGAHSPTWSPDGTRLCYASDVDTDRQKVPQEVAWFEQHPDADQNAPRMRREATLVWRFDQRGYVERRPHLFVVSATEEGAEPRQLTDGDYDDLQPAWSPDSSLIAFISNRTDDTEYNFAADVWTVDADSGESRALTDGTLGAHSPSWSPNGSAIAFYAMPEWITHGHHDVHVWTVSRGGGDQRDVSSQLDQTCGTGFETDYMVPDFTPPVWSQDGRTIYFTANDHGDEAIFALTLDTGAVRRVSTTHGYATGPQCTPDGQMLLCLASTPMQPFDVFAVPSEGGELRPVTRTNGALLDDALLVEPERIAFKGPEDWEIEGWLIRPIDANKENPYPLILQVHGGPQYAWGNVFYLQKQAMAGAGYAFLSINPRGSNGYGSDFSQAADWGQNDYRDLMAGVDAVLATGEVDEKRLGITGLSYGGFMTNWTIGHTDRFRAGVSINGVASLFSMYGLSDITALWAEKAFGGAYWASEENWQWYRKHSPITYVGNVNTPLLLLQSENDYRCPIVEGEQMLTALRMRRQTVELIRIPGPSHVIFLTGMPHQKYLHWTLTKEWFDTYIMGKAEMEPVRPEEEAGVTAEAVTP